MSYLTSRCIRLLPSFVRLLGKRSLASGNKLVEVSLNEDSGVTTVTLNRPPVNSLNLELLQQICSTIDDLENNQSAGMIITSALPTVFSAGLDLREMYKTDSVHFQTFWTAFQDMWLKLYGTTFPTVSAICGHAPAGGCLIAMSCDYRIMVESPKFTVGINDTKVGIVVPTFVQKTMSNLIGVRKTELALTTGRLFSVVEALRIGLIDEIATNKGDAIKKAEAYLDKFVALTPSAVSMTKSQTRETTLDWLIQNKESDLYFYTKWFQMPEVQKTLRLILENLGSRKK